jgi:hypothetical protein
MLCAPATTEVVINRTTFFVPNYYVCPPITGQVMVHPLKTPSGLHFEQTAILSWLRGSERFPLKLETLKPSDLTPCKNLKHEIRIWRKKQTFP